MDLFFQNDVPDSWNHDKSLIISPSFILPMQIQVWQSIIKKIRSPHRLLRLYHIVFFPLKRVNNGQWNTAVWGS